MYLSNLKYRDLLFKLDRNSLENVVFCNDIIRKKADIAIVLGGTSMIPYRVDKAVELYRSGAIKTILVSGGVGYLNFKRKITEAELMKDYLLTAGVLEKNILVEDKSRNTYENFLYSYKLLESRFNLKETSFILITSSFHMRRSIMLFNHFFKNSQFGTNSVCDGKTDKLTWTKSFYGKRIIKQEIWLLKYYIKRLKLSDIKIK